MKILFKCLTRWPIHVYKRLREESCGGALKLHTNYGDGEYKGKRIQILHITKMEHYEALEIDET